jgi:prevent-host-death family protein
MVSINIRELMHHFSGYLKEVKSGERIIIMERNVPVAELVPHNAHLESPGWKRDIRKIKISGGSIAKTVERMRSEER